MDDILKYILTLAPGLLQGLPGAILRSQMDRPTETEAQPERRFEGISESILSQMAKAGKPRRTVSTTIGTMPEEPLNWGNLMMILMMMLQGGEGPSGGLGDIGPPTDIMGIQGEAPGPMF